MTSFIKSTYSSISTKSSRERVANAVWEFSERPEIKNVLAILDFRDFQKFEIDVPGSQSPKRRRINNDFLNRALRSYNDMSIIANGLDSLIKKSEESLKALIEEFKQEEIERQEQILKGFETEGFDVQTQIGSKKIIIEKLDRSHIKRFHESFTDEVVVRQWFVDFLDGLARFENWIKSGLTTADELKPFLIYWIEVIADRKKCRRGGSSFFDSLFLFIHETGYEEVIDLFKRYKYVIPKPTYSEVKIKESCLDTKLDKNQADKDEKRESNIKRAALLSSAAKLCYEDELYIKDWVFKWTLSSVDSNQKENDSRIKSSTSSTKTVLREVINFLQKEQESSDILEGKEPYEELNIDFFDDYKTNTFAVAFTLPLEEQKRATIVAFRGTVNTNIQNWRTNIDTKLTSLEPKDKDNNKVLVHEGFAKSWGSIKDEVFEFVDKEAPDLIFLTGHSLGGALAVIAAVDFCRDKNYKDKFGGVYTFGQPKVGNPAFANYFNFHLDLKDQMARFVNNSDFVPRIPTFAGLFKYAHNIGNRYYFCAFGKLVLSGDHKLWFILLRDRIIGLPRFLINLLVKSKISLIEDHDISIYVRCTKESLQEIEREKTFTSLN